MCNYTKIPQPIVLPQKPPMDPAIVLFGLISGHNFCLPKIFSLNNRHGCQETHEPINIKQIKKLPFWLAANNRIKAPSKIST